MFTLLEEGKAGAIITGPWYSQRIADTLENYSIDPIPGVEGVTENGSPFSGGQGFVISAFSQNQLLAETFLFDYLATPEFMQAIFDAGGRPATFASVDTSANPNVAGFMLLVTTPSPCLPFRRWLLSGVRLMPL